MLILKPVRRQLSVSLYSGIARPMVNCIFVPCQLTILWKWNVSLRKR